MVPNFIHSCAFNKCKKPLKLFLDRRVVGQLFDRQKCSEKCESFILHINYNKIVIGGWFPISFIHVPEKNAKLLKLLLEGDGEKVR